MRAPASILLRSARHGFLASTTERHAVGRNMAPMGRRRSCCGCCWQAGSGQRTSITPGGIGRVDRRVGQGLLRASPWSRWRAQGHSDLGPYPPSAGWVTLTSWSRPLGNMEADTRDGQPVSPALTMSAVQAGSMPAHTATVRRQSASSNRNSCRFATPNSRDISCRGGTIIKSDPPEGGVAFYVNIRDPPSYVGGGGRTPPAYPRIVV
jgi:hypothetical protein